MLVWERLWPLLAPIATLAALFVALSWLGLWRYTGTPLRLAILALFAAALVYCLFRLARFSPPSRAAAFSRVEQATGAEHRPATSFSDRLASAPDPTADILWAAHRRRLLATLARLRSGTPKPRLDRYDPFAFRFLVALLFVVGIVVAGPEIRSRIGEAFVGGESTAATVARIDAWVTPPDYTGRPPIFLTGDAAKPPGTEYSVPAGSVVTVRTGGVHDLKVVAERDGGTETITPEPAKATEASLAADAAPPLEHQVTLTAAASVAVRKGGRDISVVALHRRTRRAADRRARQRPDRSAERRAAPHLQRSRTTTGSSAPRPSSRRCPAVPTTLTRGRSTTRRKWPCRCRNCACARAPARPPATSPPTRGRARRCA